MPVTAMQPGDWLGLVIVLAAAAVLRLVFYTGFLGTDEVTYVETAVNIAAGDWRASNYIGGIRYGMNLPLALFIRIFGISEASANLWPFLCSIGEVAIVFFVARWLWGAKAAMLSAALLTLLPLHVHYAGRILPDAPLAFVLTLSCALLLLAARTRNSLAWCAAGLACGGVFWIKESVAILYLPVFLLLGFLLSRIDRGWLWLFGGMGLAVAANCALMYILTGNPMHVFAVIGGSLESIGGLSVETSPWYYLRYLFLDIRHTFLTGLLSVAGAMLYVKHFTGNRHVEPGARFVVCWLLLLLGMFSFAVVSVAPLKLIVKQTNYMLIFAAPLTLLAGWFLASQSRKILIPLAALIVTGSLLLAALAQQDVTVFTANSKASFTFLRDRPNAFLVGTTNNQRAVNFFSMMDHRPELRNRIMSFGELAAITNTRSLAELEARTEGKEVFTVMDLQTINWGYNRGPIRRLADVPSCWAPNGSLTPLTAGFGQWAVKGLVAAGNLLPSDLEVRFTGALQPVLAPLPAYVFRVDNACLMQPAL